MKYYTIKEGQLMDVIGLLPLIPEFYNIPSFEEVQNRIAGSPHLVLAAYVDGKPAGFKIGYERDHKFYSWLGAIHPDYRRTGIGSGLAEYQENWAKNNGYDSIWMKTRNCFPEMLIMAISRGFRIIGFIPHDDPGQHRIILEKSL